jgi:effector-binding domain-containing protein
VVFRDGVGGELDLEVGIQVAERFEDTEPVVCSETPGGEVAVTVHWGPYAKLPVAHDAVVRWCRANGRTSTGVRWEVYGHWDSDPAKLQSEVVYQLDPIGS